MAKFCVFCGDKPKEKTKEHIIPKWLIEYTGELKRLIQVGEKNFSFDQLTFPACDKCNNDYSELEGKAKNALLKIFNNEELTDIDVNNLLDWFDKVRIGLWLLSLKMVNYFPELTDDIEPKFYISQRIRKADRLLNIVKINNTRKGINFVGTVSPQFLLTPSCFGLIINNYFFTNISYNFLFNERLGFPKIKSMSYDENFNITASLSRTPGKLKTPLVLDIIENSGITFFQPIVPTAAVKFIDESRKQKLLYKPYANGVGKLYLHDKNYKFFNKKSLELDVKKGSIIEYDDMLMFYKKISNIQEHIQKNITVLPKFSKGVPNEIKQGLKLHMDIVDKTHSKLHTESFNAQSQSIMDTLVDVIKKDNDQIVDPMKEHENIKAIAELILRKSRGENVSLGMEKRKR